MKTVKVKATGAVDEFGARIDDEILKFSTGEEATRDCATGRHFLQYFAIAPPGSSFKIEITAPPEAMWARVLTIPNDGIVVASKKFFVNPE